MIDKDKLFALFGNSNSKGDELLDAKQEILEAPFTKIGMFTKLIVNHWVFHEKLKQFLSKENPNYDIEETKAASEFTVFNRAWYYIKEINIDKEQDLSAIIQFKSDPFISALEAAINYFEDPDIEEYERCAFLHKILKIKKEV
tara:strand:+ start:1621 stop:2049 length:429 start_codon:yes stop_codon:yes gene_type:complete